MIGSRGKNLLRLPDVYELGTVTENSKPGEGPCSAPTSSRLF
jgi:hypothetical protein